MTAVKNILFDFDGTLMDTWPGIAATLRASLRTLDIPIHEDAITRTLVGIPLLKVFEELLGNDTVRADLAARKYRELFPVVGKSGARPYKGVVRLLDELTTKGRESFLVTARNEVIAKQMMVDHGLDGFFTWVRGEREGEAPDGKAHMVAEVLEMFNLDPDDCVMVGDRRYDIDAALINGMKAVGVTYGYGTVEELTSAGAGRIVGSIEDLGKALLNNQVRGIADRES